MPGPLLFCLWYIQVGCIAVAITFHLLMTFERPYDW